MSPRSNQSISIHALCEEGDRRLCTHPEPTGYFYPRPLRGGRPTASPMIKPCSVFLSTPSARRATIPRYFDKMQEAISIHALCEEGDCCSAAGCAFECVISIHALCEEGDLVCEGKPNE